jgi:probable HAF family extracellular repeat protein
LPDQDAPGHHIPGQMFSAGLDIDNTGRVVGYSTSSQGVHAALWANGSIVDLGTLSSDVNDSSSAAAINDRGQVVGYSFASGVQRAFIWDGSAMIDLNSLVGPSLGFTLMRADDINDRGYIIAAGDNGHSYLLTPIPEPSTYALMLLGLGVLGVATKRRRGDRATVQPSSC